MTYIRYDLGTCLHSIYVTNWFSWHHLWKRKCSPLLSSLCYLVKNQLWIWRLVPEQHPGLWTALFCALVILSRLQLHCQEVWRPLATYFPNNVLFVMDCHSDNIHLTWSHLIHKCLSPDLDIFFFQWYFISFRVKVLYYFVKCIPKYFTLYAAINEIVFINFLYDYMIL